MFLIRLFLIGKQLLSKLHNIFFPRFCALCDIVLAETLLLCCACSTIFRPIVSKKIGTTKKSSFVVHAFSFYQDECRSLIHAKYYGDQALFYDLGCLVADHIEKSNILFDVIVPIPLHMTRYAWRGFNQAETIAQAISDKTGKPVVHILKRTKRTQYQSQLSKVLRKENLKSAFSINLFVAEFMKYKNAKILLVDDVYTTGSTVQEAVCELKKYDFRFVEVFVVFRG